MKTYTLKIQPNEAFYLRGVPGDYVRVKTSAVELKIESIESQGRDSVEVVQGDDFNFSPFQTLMVSHSDAAEQTVKLMISTGKKASASPTSNQVTVASGVVTVNNLSADQGAILTTTLNVGAASAVQLRPAKINRRYLMVQNNDAYSVLRVRFDATAPNATSGVRLLPGESIEFQGFCPTASVFARMETPATNSANVEVLEG